MRRYTCRPGSVTIVLMWVDWLVAGREEMACGSGCRRLNTICEYAVVLGLLHDYRRFFGFIQK